MYKGCVGWVGQGTNICVFSNVIQACPPRSGVKSFVKLLWVAALGKHVCEIVVGGRVE